MWCVVRRDVGCMRAKKKKKRDRAADMRDSRNRIWSDGGKSGRLGWVAGREPAGRQVEKRVCKLDLLRDRGALVGVGSVGSVGRQNEEKKDRGGRGGEGGKRCVGYGHPVNYLRLRLHGIKARWNFP